MDKDILTLGNVFCFFFDFNDLSSLTHAHTHTHLHTDKRVCVHTCTCS